MKKKKCKQNIETQNTVPESRGNLITTIPLDQFKFIVMSRKQERLQKNNGVVFMGLLLV